MSVIGSGAAAASLTKAARDGVKATWLAKNRRLSPGEIEQMQLEMEEAALNALFAHLAANLQVNGVAAVGLVAPPGGGPVTGAVILPPGSVT